MQHNPSGRFLAEVSSSGGVGCIGGGRPAYGAGVCGRVGRKFLPMSVVLAAIAERVAGVRYPNDGAVAIVEWDGVDYSAAGGKAR